LSEVHPLKKKFKSLPESFRGLIQTELSIGHIYELTDMTEMDREDLGLPPRPPTAYSDSKALEELKKIAKMVEIKKDTGLDVEKLEFEW